MNEDTGHDQAALCQVAILAGGMGTRLRTRTGSLPKPMAPICGRPVLEHQIELCRRHGFTRIALLVHYEHEVIRNHFGDGRTLGVDLTYCVEVDARGTAGALRDALGVMAPRCLVLYGDTYADIDLMALWLAHSRAHKTFHAVGTLLLHPNDHPYDSDLVEVLADGQIVRIHPYPHPEGKALRNMVNAALYVLERSGLAAAIPSNGKYDLAKHTFPVLLASGQTLFGHVTPEYIKDMGTPDRLDKIEGDIRSGLPQRLSPRSLRAAVFLDRDGTLVKEVGHLSEPAEIELLPNVGASIRRLNRAGLLAVCVTNQPVVARGEVTAEGLNGIHAVLDHQLGRERAFLDRLYFCPHHPDGGFDGEVPDLKIVCECRKPATGLIDRAVRELEISRSASWMVGDTTADMLAGHRAGLRTILVRTGHAGADGKYAVEPDYEVPSLDFAVNWILDGHAATVRQLVGLELLSALQATDIVLVGGLARAGKSHVSRVLAELAAATGRRAHVLPLDGWLKPLEKRPEGTGVLARYDLATAARALEQGRINRELEWPSYDRLGRRSSFGRRIDVSPDDLLIVEGVPALLLPLAADAAVRIYVETDEATRVARVQADHEWRCIDPVESHERLAARDIDEVPIILSSRSRSTHAVLAGGPK